MNLNIKINTHSSICLNENIYIDPYKIEKDYNNAQFIFITHTHYDHLDIDSIKKIMNNNSVFVCTEDCASQLKEFGIDPTKIKVVEPNKNYELNNISFKTFHSYNINKNFHPKSNNWVGYNILIDNINYMICGDSDLTPELTSQKTDVLFVPIGGTYTMTAEEGALLANQIKPKLVIPVHYGSLVGNKESETTFLNYLDKSLNYKLLINI